ncbi:hypothetical protein TNCV_4248301 [Trichonephila clavipes]|nr:hypothetical protein TNCV_4248301 [Trichonephila clavipes]
MLFSILSPRCLQTRIRPSWCCRQMCDSSVKAISFPSDTHILLSSHHWRRRRLWFCVKGRPSNDRLEDRPLYCKRRRMRNFRRSPSKADDKQQRYVGGHKDKELQLFTFLHDEGKQTKRAQDTRDPRFLLLYRQRLLRNSSSDWTEWAGQEFWTSRLRLQCYF